VNRGLPIAAEVAECLGTLSLLLGVSYLSAWAHRLAARRSPAPAPAEDAGEPAPGPAVVYVDGPLIMSGPARPFVHVREDL